MISPSCQANESGQSGQIICFVDRLGGTHMSLPAAKTQQSSSRGKNPPDSVIISPADIQGYLNDLAAKGRGPGPLKGYSVKLENFFTFLPEDKHVTAQTLERWRSALLEQGYSPATINTHISAVNGLLAYLGHRDLQLLGQLETLNTVQPELTRAEYLRLLQTARHLDKERTYLLIKVFALLGLRVCDVKGVSVEAVNAGCVLASNNSGQNFYVPIPACLKTELLAYIARIGLRSGPVFVTRNGKCLRRTQISMEIRMLCHDARVDEEKGNPRCLRKLYQTTQENMEASVHMLVEQAHERLLNTEQLAVGWEEGFHSV